MEMVAERRTDGELRAVIDQAIEYKKTLGQNVAVSFLVEHYVPPCLLQRVLMQEAEPAFDAAEDVSASEESECRTG